MLVCQRAVGHESCVLDRVSRDQFDTGSAAVIVAIATLHSPSLPPSPSLLRSWLCSAQPLPHLPAVAATAVVLNRPMKTLGSAVKLEARKRGGHSATFSASRQHALHMT